MKFFALLRFIIVFKKIFFLASLLFDSNLRYFFCQKMGFNLEPCMHLRQTLIHPYLNKILVQQQNLS